MSTILIADDDPGIRDVVSYALTNQGLEVEAVPDGETALDRARAVTFDVVILDVMMPGMSGIDVCRALRAESSVPIVMLTAKDAEVDRVLGLELGADDYVTKPFSPRELAARVRTVLRRARGGELPAERLAFGDLELDAQTREVRKAGAEVRLTAKEFDLLWFLASHPRRVFGRDQLMSRVWGYKAAHDTGTVTVHIRRLRAKIELDPSNPVRLETVWGVGYRFLP